MTITPKSKASRTVVFRLMHAIVKTRTRIFLIPVVIGILWAISGSWQDVSIIHAMSLFAATPFRKFTRSHRPTVEDHSDTRSEEHAVSVLSHEFRTPLSVILGYADLLRAEVDDRHLDAVEAIEQSGQKLLTTLNSVLDWIEISEDRQTTHMSAFDFGAVLNDVIATHRELAEEKGLRFVCIAPVGIIEMNSDENRLGRILDYLLDNAVKFTSEGEIRVSLSSSPDSITIAISDTGVGMDEGQREMLASPFVQGSTGDDRLYGGVGLGLTLATKSVRLLGGDIQILNRQEGGTRVEVTFPRAPGNSARKVA